MHAWMNDWLNAWMNEQTNKVKWKPNFSEQLDFNQRSGSNPDGGLDPP